MTATSGILIRSLRTASVAGCLAAAAVVSIAQTGISVLTPTYVRLSSTGTSVTDPFTYSTAPLSLTCPAVPITAVLSSTADGTGNVLVDNILDLTVTQGSSTPIGPVNLCGNTLPGNPPTSCFNSGYAIPSGEGKLTGDDPDGAIAAEGGLSPRDIHGYLAPGANLVTLNLVDTGGYLASTSLYLYTNCTSNGAIGNGKISGNPIPTNDPTSPLLTQSFTFSSTDKKVVQGVVDYSTAALAGTLDVTPGTTPTQGDQAIDPLKWPGYVAGTSFATSNCLIHNGELLETSMTPACKLYTLTCQIGQGAEGTGPQCPSSTARNIVLKDDFDGPEFFLPDISSGKDTFHQGFGYLEAPEGWTGGACMFDPAAGQVFSCPENLLVQFTGPGLFHSSSTPQPSINSSFIGIGPVPEDLTYVDFEGYDGHVWVNSKKVKVRFHTKPPVVPEPNNGFVAAPIYGITYGLSKADELPSTEFPVPGDVTLLNPDGCPGVLPAAEFMPGHVNVEVPEDGRYLIHYFATDCAGTEELKFYEDASKSWHTTFYTAGLYVDTVNPKVVAGPILSPPPTMIHGVLGYAVGQQVTATYQCSDSLSGVQICGDQYYLHPLTNPAAVTSPVNTATKGTKMYTVVPVDAAANVGSPQSIAYTVVP